MQSITFFLIFLHFGRCGTILSFIERITKTLASLCHLLFNLLIIFGNLVLDKHIRTITLLAVSVVNKRIIESIHVTTGLPDGGMHKNTRIYADDVVMKQYHTLPPVLLNIVFQFNAILPIIVYGAQTVINL